MLFEYAHEAAIYLLRSPARFRLGTSNKKEDKEEGEEVINARSEFSQPSPVNCTTLSTKYNSRKALDLSIAWNLTQT